MNFRRVTSFQGLQTLKFGEVLFQKAGAFYKARFAGRANCTFGITKSEAEARLRSGRLPR